MNKEFKIRVTDKRTGKVVSYFKISDTDTHSYDLYTGYEDINNKEIYTGDVVELETKYFDGTVIDVGMVSKNIDEIDFMAINEKETGIPLVIAKRILKKD